MDYFFGLSVDVGRHADLKVLFQTRKKLPCALIHPEGNCGSFQLRANGGADLFIAATPNTSQFRVGWQPI